MQRVSNRMALTIHNLFSIDGFVSNFYSGSTINYEANNVFTDFFKIDVQGNNVELPIFAKYLTQSRLVDMVQSGKRGTIVIPFTRNRNPRVAPATFRSADTLIRCLIESKPCYSSMCIAAKTNKDELYYGANGLLFDKDMNLLFLSSVEGDIDGTTINYRKAKAYINPSVFYSEGTVEKCLINKIIPFLLTRGVDIYARGSGPTILNYINYDVPGNSHTYHRATPEIVVSDIKNKFFCKPVSPSVSFKDEDINELLHNNLDGIFRIMGIV